MTNLRRPAGVQPGFPDKPVAQWNASGRGAGCSAEALLGDAGHVERIRAALSRPFAILAA
ncbi:hypothetical protein [Dyella sp.]|uniref:hypothetical protein n=1 Tax=Dyella sp. TaxID=1869338 RepID=UPI00321712E6